MLCKKNSKDRSKKVLLVKIIGLGSYPDIPQEFTKEIQQIDTAYKAPEQITQWIKGSF